MAVIRKTILLFGCIFAAGAALIMVLAVSTCAACVSTGIETAQSAADAMAESAADDIAAAVEAAAAREEAEQGQASQAEASVGEAQTAEDANVSGLTIDLGPEDGELVEAMTSFASWHQAAVADCDRVVSAGRDSDSGLLYVTCSSSGRAPRTVFYPREQVLEVRSALQSGTVPSEADVTPLQPSQ